jgi:glutamine synthetase
MHSENFIIYPELLYVLPKNSHSPETIRQILCDHPEVQFVSLAGIDLAGNDTDERIPIQLFVNNIESYLHGGVQTDGSSVVLPGIAKLNDGKVDLLADVDVSWYVDYNYENLDFVTGYPCGTLRIPAFLSHNNKLVCSRSLLRRAIDRFDTVLKSMFRDNPQLCLQWDFQPEDIAEITLTSATELEFWVRTPDHFGNREQLSVSQGLKEQYWKRTKGAVRTALERAITLLELYGLNPEMGHKEVGGVKAHLTGSGSLDHIMEQLEIDWRFSTSMQAGDNELFARIFIKEVFRLHGLEASFLAKPMEGVAGSGEHVHVNAVAILKSGRRVNLFSPADFELDFLNSIGWGALMGFMKHYDAISAFITVSNDAFNRLKPGFEAPTHTVASIGRDLKTPSRNRTVLVGLIRSADSPISTRFEVRSPNPHTNTYIALSAIFQAMLDGICRNALRKPAELELEFCKKAGEPAVYLRSDRMYRSEDDIFSDYSDTERDHLFGKPPATVYETLRLLLNHNEGQSILCDGDVFSDPVITSFSRAMLDTWEMELSERIIGTNLSRIRSCVKTHQPNPYDDDIWERINAIRNALAVTTLEQKSLFDEIRQSLTERNLKRASELQRVMDSQMRQMEGLYLDYQHNQIHFQD